MSLIARHTPSLRESRLKTKRKVWISIFLWAGLQSRGIKLSPFISILQGFRGFESNSGGACLPALSVEMCSSKTRRTYSEMKEAFPHTKTTSNPAKRPTDNFLMRDCFKKRLRPYLWPRPLSQKGEVFITDLVMSQKNILQISGCIKKFLCF